MDCSVNGRCQADSPEWHLLCGDQRACFLGPAAPPWPFATAPGLQTAGRMEAGAETSAAPSPGPSHFSGAVGHPPKGTAYPVGSPFPWHLGPPRPCFHSQALRLPLPDPFPGSSGRVHQGPLWVPFDVPGRGIQVCKRNVGALLRLEAGGLEGLCGRFTSSRPVVQVESWRGSPWLPFHLHASFLLYPLVQPSLWRSHSSPTVPCGIWGPP